MGRGLALRRRPYDKASGWPWGASTEAMLDQRVISEVVLFFILNFLELVRRDCSDVEITYRVGSPAPAGGMWGASDIVLGMLQ